MTLDGRRTRPEHNRTSWSNLQQLNAVQRTTVVGLSMLVTALVTCANLEQLYYCTGKLSIRTMYGPYPEK